MAAAPFYTILTNHFSLFFFYVRIFMYFCKFIKK